MSVLVVSSTGSVSQNAIVTDYDNPAACIQMAKEINGSTELEYNNIKIKVYSKAVCDTREVTARGVPIPQVRNSPELPPGNPFIPFFDGMSRFIQQQQGR
jgi:hypothetical protein